jgi:hypothetical protein
MVTQPIPIFQHLTLLELNLGLYDATYRTCLDGTQLIVVDGAKSRPVQRAAIARTLYIAFCRSPRATELDWPHRNRSQDCCDLFARCLLMPAAWVEQTRDSNLSPEAIAAHFDVPVSMAHRRLNEIELHALPSSDAPRRGGEGNTPKTSKTTVAPALTQTLAHDLFSLAEPWQARFLELVANLATNWAARTHRPSPGEIAGWLSADPTLYRDVRLLIDAWRKPQMFYYLNQWKFDLSTSRRDLLTRVVH